MKTITRTIFACFVILALSGCHKEEVMVDDEMPTIVWTEYIKENYYYDDYYGHYDGYYDYDYPQGTRVVVHYSDNSMVFFGNYQYREELTCIGNRYATGESSNGNFALEIPESIIARTDLESSEWYINGHFIYGIDTLPVVAVSGGSFDQRLTSVTLPSSIFRGFHEIEEGAFVGCTSLHTVTFQTGIESIQYGACYGAFKEWYDGDDDHAEGFGPSDVTLILPEGVKDVYGESFANCTSFKKVVFPSSIQRVDENAFLGCASLHTVSFQPGIDAIHSSSFRSVFKDKYNDYQDDHWGEVAGSSDVLLVFPDGLKSIEDGAFENCSSLTNVVFPEGLESIGDKAFRNCSSLTNVVFLDGLVSIGPGAFANGTSLTNVVFPDGLASIEYGAFVNCTSLATCTCFAKVPPYLYYSYWDSHSSSFYNTALQAIYVPRESVEAYKAAVGWSNYADIIYPIE